MEGLVKTEWTDAGADPSFLGDLHPDARPTRAREEPMRDLVPGGYLFTHLVFWSVVALIAVGTNAVPIILSVGVVLLAVEAFKAR